MWLTITYSAHQTYPSKSMLIGSFLFWTTIGYVIKEYFITRKRRKIEAKIKSENICSHENEIGKFCSKCGSLIN